MPMKRIVVRGGVDVEKSPSCNSDGWVASNCIGWREGLPEAKLGFAQISSQVLSGTARSIHYWEDLNGIPRLAVGTNNKLYAVQYGAVSDITPTSGFAAGSASSGINVPFSLLVWSIDNFGQNLIAVPSGQGIFVWVPPTLASPATRITQSPNQNFGLLVLDQIQIVMAWGSSPLSNAGAADPMMVRWSDQSDYTVWVASTTNQAGSFRLPHGSRIIGGMQIPNMTLLWTDIGLWSVQYIGFPLIFSFQPTGQNCGLIAQKAAVTLGGIVYWMSDHGFFRLSGQGAAQIPCPVWDLVFKNIDHTNQDKCIAGANYSYSEVWWFYPSINGGTGEIDSYVKLNIQEGEWDYGPATTGVANIMSRTAWTDQNNPGQPISVDLKGLLQQSDQGFTQNGGAAIPSSIRSGFVDISDGDKMMSVDQFIPDFLWDGPNPSLNITFYFRDWPGDAPTVMGPFPITPATENVTLRQAINITIGTTVVTAYPAVRGREVAIQIDGVSGWWRLGNCRLQFAASGEL